MKWAWLLAACCALPLPAWSGRPLSTEDASVLGDKACQVEGWIDRARDTATGWLVPACNFGAGIEWQAGFARTREAGTQRFSEAYVQAKTVFRSVDDAPWGFGAVAGLTRQPLRETRRGYDDPYALLIFSAKAADAALFHLNAGWSRDRAERRDVATWGAAVEGEVSPRLTLLAEAFGESRERPFLRAGARFVVIPDRLSVDLTFVGRASGTRDEQFVSLGFAWQSGPFLP